MKQDKKVNEFIEEELDVQFPKGDKARGRALVLVAVAQHEIDKLDKEINKLTTTKINDFNVGYKQGVKDIINRLKKELEKK
jgi:uncharacterized protein YbgA (DUF1722 family)